MAKTCPECSYAFNDDGAELCSQCNAELGDVSPDRDPGDLIPGQGNASPDSGVLAGNSLTGRIAHIERHDETPEINIYRWISKLLIYIPLVLPFVIWFFVFGFLSLSFAIVGFSTLATILNPIPLTIVIVEFMEVRVLGGLRRAETVPVYRGSIEANGKSEYEFQMRGPLRSGNFVVGQIVQLSGTWQDNMLIVRKGCNQKTKAAIISTYSNPWRFVFFTLLFLYLGGGLYLYLQWPHFMQSLQMYFR